MWVIDPSISLICKSKSLIGPIRPIRNSIMEDQIKTCSLREKMSGDRFGLRMRTN